MDKKAGSGKLFWIVTLGIVLYAVLDVVAQVLSPHYVQSANQKAILQ